MQHFSFPLAILLGCGSLLFADSQKDLGHIMYVGDSITHGYSSASYRWFLHKLFVDNGMNYKSVGIMSGNQPNTSDTLPAGSSYRGVIFSNVHSAQSSARAWEIVGRKSGPRFKGSNISNWLGQSTVTCSGASYSGATFTGDDTPQRFFMMIGTNDLLSDHGNKLESVARDVVPALSKDVDGILDSMRQSNKQAAITLTTIPVWAHRKGIDAPATHTTVEQYNVDLKKSAKSRKIKVAEINEGLRDVSDDRPFHGHKDLFAADGLHPNNQGSMIIAGNIAQCLDWPSRTAGLPRKAAANFALNKASDFQLDFVKTKGSSMMLMGTKGKSSSVSCDLPATDCLSVELKLRVGNGAKKGWQQDEGLLISFGTKSAAAMLKVTESYLMWGDRVLYCTDMSQNTAALRISYVMGDAQEGIAAGFYIWLGDKLVGEALPSNMEPQSVLHIAVEGKLTAIISGLALDVQGSYAPLAQ
ncbi:MAG: SGNH/GDSL hydrolase family protein [Akkermansia sp.]